MKNDRRNENCRKKPCDYEIERTPTTRYEPDYEEGLTSAQAEEHRRDGWSKRIGRSTGADNGKRSLRKMHLHILI